MTRAVAVRSEADWHALRRRHVGGSEIAALFGEHPHLTRFELYHRKIGALPEPDLSDNERVFWGTILEPAIALGVARVTGWNVRKVRRYIQHPTVAGMGASLDYEIMGHERGPGVLEIKTVDSLAFRSWEDGTPPLHYELQLQHQLAVTGRAWGCIAVLVGGNDLRRFEYEARPKTIALIEREVAAFWREVEECRPPKPDFAADGATIAALYGSAEAGKVIDLTGDNRLTDLCAEYRAAAAAEKEAGLRKDVAKAEILMKIGDAAKAICGSYTISAAEVAGGVVTYERRPYRNFRLTERKTA